MPERPHYVTLRLSVAEIEALLALATGRQVEVGRETLRYLRQRLHAASKP